MYNYRYCQCFKGERHESSAYRRCTKPFLEGWKNSETRCLLVCLMLRQKKNLFNSSCFIQSYLISEHSASVLQKCPPSPPPAVCSFSKRKRRSRNGLLKITNQYNWGEINQTGARENILKIRKKKCRRKQKQIHDGDSYTKENAGSKYFICYWERE